MRAIIFLFLSLLFLVACGGSPSPSPTPDPIGALSITIEGLPTGTNASVSITGPNNFNRNITDSASLSNLTPGDYIITASNVTIGDDLYVPNPANQTKAVAANTTEAVTIVYLRQLPDTGSLNVVITGLPEGVNANTNLTGPENYEESPISSATFDNLVPGVYTLTAQNVTSGSSTFVPDPASQTVTVNSGATATAVVNYVQQASGVGNLAITITGLPDNITANVTVTGPADFNQVVTSSATLTNLTPGTYIITAPNVTSGESAYLPTPPTQTQTVSAGATVTASVNYTTGGGTVTGALQVNITGLPSGTNADVTVTGPGDYSQNVTATTTLTDLALGAYVITAENVTVAGTIYHPSPPRQEQTVTPGAPATATITYSTTPPPPPTVTEVEVRPAAGEVRVGNTLQLTAEVRGANFPPQTVTWASSNEAIATVSESGLVTALAVGGVNITATSTLDSSKSGTATVTVTPANAPDGLCANSQAVVNIPDTRLRNEIRDALNKPSGDITCADMERLVELNAPSGFDGVYDEPEDDEIISNLEGLQYARNLVELSLSSHLIADLSPLATLTNLTGLYISYNKISNIAPLANLTNLTGVGLYANQISDISPLANLTNLRGLHLANNRISNIAPLAKLTNLTELDLGCVYDMDADYCSNGNEITNISPLAGLTKLTYLGLSGNQISNISPLASLINLTLLELGQYSKYRDGPGGNQISDISPLVQNSGLGEGDEVYVEYNCLDLRESSQAMNDINTLMKRGVSVNYHNQAPCGYEPETGSLQVNISGLPAGVDANVTVTRPEGYNRSITTTTTLFDITVGDYLVSAENVTADGATYEPERSSQIVTVNANTTATAVVNYVQQASGGCVVSIPDANLQSVIRVILAKPSGDITCADMERLTAIEANSRPIASLEGLQYATNLTDLRINDAQLSDLTPLAGLRKMTFFAARGNLITDVSPLRNLTNLTTLGLGRNQISNLTPLQSLVRLTTLGLVTNQISDISPLASLVNLNILSLRDNRISNISPLLQTGLANGDELSLGENCLNLEEGSQAASDIATLRGRGVVVVDTPPQKDLSQPPCN